MVYLKIQPYRQSTIFKRVHQMHQKLARKYCGPYEILDKVGSVAYKLKLPPGSRVHPVFHVSLLKKFIGDNPAPSNELPTIDDEGAIVLEPAAAVDIRWLKRGGKFVEQGLVHWRRLPIEEATWEDTALLKERFPQLVSKEPLQGGRDDTLPRRSTRIPRPSTQYQDFV